MAEERVQKILARTGYGSRRANEELILAGRVRVNGTVAVLGTKADPQRDTITVDNQAIPKEPGSIYVALNKPQAVLSEVNADTGDSRETVRDLVQVPGHLFIVGRLDYESEGLILLTNDGELANQLTHPRYGHEKEYRVLVAQRPDDRQFDAWRHGIVMEDGYRTAPAQVRLESAAGRNVWLRVILNEGRKRQIREMGLRTGLHVMRIQRIRIGSLELGDLKPGQWRHLRPDEVRALKINKGSGRTRQRVRAPRRTDQQEAQARGGEQPGSARRGPAPRGSAPGGAAERRGPADRGPASRGSEQRRPARRGPEQPGTEQRGPEDRRPARRGPEQDQGAPQGRRPERRSPEPRRRK